VRNLIINTLTKLRKYKKRKVKASEKEGEKGKIKRSIRNLKMKLKK
jgi:hypothetical protein